MECRTGEMQGKRDAGKEGCRKGGNLDARGTGREELGTGRIQDWMDTGNERCRRGGSMTVGMPHWRDNIQEGYRTAGMQVRWDEGLERRHAGKCECRKGGI